MIATSYKGVLPAFPTPTRSDGSVDRPALQKLATFLLDNGAEGLVPIGGTGEFTALSARARLEAVEATVEVAKGRVPVVAGVLSPGFADAVEAGESYRKAGVDALLLITPFYVTPTQSGIRDYFKAYRDKVDIDILLYDIPSRTRIVVEPRTIAEMEQDRSVVGMKACNPDINHFNHTAAYVTEDFALLAGEDTHFPIQMALGAKGGILATAALLPGKWVEIYELCKSGRYREAIAAQRALLPMIDAIFAEANPGPLKAAMNLAGHAVGEVLSPLQSPKAATLETLTQVLKELGAYAPATQIRDVA
jgi:4-hydroxy-tetrahydrodipicolinate synthase